MRHPKRIFHKKPPSPYRRMMLYVTIIVMLVMGLAYMRHYRNGIIVDCSPDGIDITTYKASDTTPLK